VNETVGDLARAASIASSSERAASVRASATSGSLDELHQANGVGLGRRPPAVGSASRTASESSARPSSAQLEQRAAGVEPDCSSALATRRLRSTRVESVELRVPADAGPHERETVDPSASALCQDLALHP
jgi:hypothetical protein